MIPTLKARTETGSEHVHHVRDSTVLFVAAVPDCGEPVCLTAEKSSINIPSDASCHICRWLRWTAESHAVEPGVHGQV